MTGRRFSVIIRPLKEITFIIHILQTKQLILNTRYLGQRCNENQLLIKLLLPKLE